jgi:hypothetical protein
VSLMICVGKATESVDRLAETTLLYLVETSRLQIQQSPPDIIHKELVVSLVDKPNNLSKATTLTSRKRGRVIAGRSSYLYFVRTTQSPQTESNSRPYDTNQEARLGNLSQNIFLFQ